MNLKRTALTASSVILLAAAALADGARSAYSYVRESTGEVLVDNALNGETLARRNMPITAGDAITTEDPARAEIAMADGNVLHVGGGTRVKFSSLNGQQGSDDEVSAVGLSEGSVILSVVGNDEGAVPRIDTEDATVYASAGSRVRVNADSRRGTGVVVRAGSVEVKARSGSYTVRAGNYLLVQGDQEPEIARGSFSRDRFDLWAADRLEATYDSPKSASAQYVGEDYSGDVVALDGYGDWDYSTTYSSYVWRPNVAVGWTPYSYGSWYYTPVGLTWWSSDPWGWYPYHYGNWFFDAGWNNWCWSPGYVYSPAWVYWGYTSSYFGWCPVGWYSPWWNNYYRDWTYPRASVAFAINGRFATRTVDMRGWNFTGVSNLGQTRGRVPVVAGTRAVGRIGEHISVSSRPIVLPTRPTGPGGVGQGLRDYVREAPRVIERTSGRDSERLAPVLARDANLPRATVEALRERTVVVERGRLMGPGAMDLAPRGATVVERGSSGGSIESTQRGATDPSTGRGLVTDRAPSREITERGRTIESPGRSVRPEAERAAPRSEGQDSWRGRPAEVPGRSEQPRSQARDDAAPGGAWRGQAPRSSPGQGQSRNESSQRSQDWRSRGDVPPARRVIEGAVPGRRSPDAAPSREDGQRSYGRNTAPVPRDYAPRESAPRDRGYSAPPSRDSSPRSMDRAPAPAPRAAPAPSRAAPAPRSAPAPSAPRSAPAPSRGSPPSSSGRPGRP